MSNKNSYDPYEQLANAIVLAAVRDYRDANRKLSRGRKPLKPKRSAYDFFALAGLRLLLKSIQST